MGPISRYWPKTSSLFLRMSQSLCYAFNYWRRIYSLLLRKSLKRLGQSMLFCSKLCNINLEQFLKLLHSRKLCVCSHMQAYYFNIVLLQSWAMCTFCDLGCPLDLSSVEYFHPTNIASFGHPFRSYYPAIVG